MILEGEPLLINDGNGTIVEVTPLLTSQRRRFKQFFALAARLLDEAGGAHDRVYDDNRFFRHAVHTCLSQFGLDGEVLDLRLIILLLFSRPVAGADGKAQWGNGLLIDWEFPSAATEGAGVAMDVEPELQDLALAWIADGGSLEKIMVLAEKYPHRDLAKIVEARGEFLSQHRESTVPSSKVVPINPKVVMPDGTEENLDIAAELESLREDIVSELADKKRWQSDGWEEVKVAGFS